METQNQVRSKLFTTTVVDEPDDVEKKLEQAYQTVTSMTSDMSETEAHDTLSAAVSKDMHQHEMISFGLTYSILVHPTSAPKSYRDLALVTRDGLGLVIYQLNQIISDKYQKLQEKTRAQLLWFAQELVKNSVSDVEKLCFSLLKQIAGGDISPKNIWLAESVLNLLNENKAWLEKQTHLLAVSVFTYLRILEDHNSTSLSSLKQKEVDFCISLLREKFMDCTTIGRDLVRLLQNVARIPEFEKLWQDMLYSPQLLSPQFSGILQLMTQRTSKRFLATRLTHEMENKLLFLTSKVKFGQHKRYQDWFQKQYLSTPESQTLRCDIIRYICGVIHPSNEILCSEIIPRWAVIGWLLTTCTSNVAASSAKLSLFYDWLFFQPNKDSIMNIEPAILVMYHSMKQHPAITATLLDFLCRIIPNFYKVLENQVRQGINASLKDILEKRVLTSLSPLFDNPKLDKELRSMILNSFREFCSVPEGKEVTKIVEPMPSKEPPLPLPLPPPPPIVSEDVEMNNKETTPQEATFSDEEEEPACKIPKNVFRPIRQVEEVDITQCLEQLEGGEIGDSAKKLYDERDLDMETQCENVESLCETLLETDDFDSEQAVPLASFLLKLCQSHFKESILPEEITEEALEESIGKPLFVLFRNLIQGSGECSIQLLTLVCMMYDKHPQIGYNLLYFLVVSSKPEANKLHFYEEVCKNTEQGNLEACLLKDFQALEDYRLLGFLVSPVFKQFQDSTAGKAKLLRTIFSCLDPSQLQDLLCEVMYAELVMIKDENILDVLEVSLEWETFEQYCLWQLLFVHDDIPFDSIIPIITKLNYTKHAEALSNLLLMLKCESVSVDLLKYVMCRDCQKSDRFTPAILCHWAIQDDEDFANLLRDLIGKVTANSRRKTQRSKQVFPTIDQIVFHLDVLRQTPAIRQCTLFTQEPLLLGLQLAQSTCSDSQKASYMELFALTEEIESSRTTRSRQQRRSPGNSSPRAGSGRRPTSVNYIEPQSSSDSEEEDEIPLPKKRKKRTNQVNGSDSD